MGERHLALVTIADREGKPIWQGGADVSVAGEIGFAGTHVMVFTDAPLELVPQEFPFVRLPREEDPE